MTKWIFLLLFIANAAFAAHLEDIQVLSADATEEGYRVQLRPAASPKDSYFYIDITKNDPAALEKMGHLLSKLTQGATYKLDITIPSFSEFPYGSSYSSEGLKFVGVSSNKVKADNNKRSSEKTKKK